MLYFAYGSNLSGARLRDRIFSAKLVNSGYLLRHRLCFHKVGLDGSAKCDAFETENGRDVVLGVLYRINPTHKTRLDRIEGLGGGYAEKRVAVLTGKGETREAFTYCATNIDTNLDPYHWYKGHVLIGAREQGFPEEYIDRFLTVESVDDPDPERAEREMRIHGLGRTDRLGSL